MKKLIFINTVLLYTILLFSGYGHSADYYIDATHGDDLNEGNSLTMPLMLPIILSLDLAVPGRRLQKLVTPAFSPEIISI